MLTFVIRRLLALPLILLAVTLLIVLVMQLIPPEQRAAAYASNLQQLSQIPEIIKGNHLDGNVFEQYGLWLRQALSGNLGFSRTSGQPVLPTLLSRFPATLELALYTLVPLIALGVWLGGHAAGQLVLTLDRNVPSLLDALSQAYVVPRKALVAGGDWSGTARDFAAFLGKDVANSVLAQKPVGTGAYQFVARDPNRFILKVFPGYWGGAPALKNVILQKVDSDTARVLALQKGDADIVIVPDRDTLAKLKGMAGVTVYESLPSRDLSTVVLFNQNVKNSALLPAGQLAENNMPVNLFSDIHVRRGFAALFDAQTFTRDALQGFGVTKNTTLPPNNWADDKTLRPPAYSLKTAEAEFRQAWGGKLWSTGFTIPIDFFAGSGLSEVVSGIFKQNIERLNPKFHVQVNTVELSAANAALLGGKLPVAALTWGGADPDTVLRGLYSAQGILAPATGIRDAKLETLLDQANNAVGQSARKPLYRTLLTYLNQQMYGFPLPQPLTWAATASTLKGYQNFHRTNLLRTLSK